MIKTYRNRLDRIREFDGANKDKLIFEQEKLIHDIILPRGTDGKKISTYDSCNLWMIDERLNQYVYLTSATYSNKGFKTFSNIDSTDKPDIILFGDKDDQDKIGALQSSNLSVQNVRTFR